MRFGASRSNGGYIGNSNFSLTPFASIYSLNKSYKTQAIEPQWYPPPDWLALPDIADGDQRFIGLMQIIKGASGNTGSTADSNFISINAGGNYIVDWGDGTTSAHASGTNAYKQYNFENVSASTETTDGYRQVIVQVYPQTGQNLTTLLMSNRTYGTGGINLTSSRSSNLCLDYKTAIPNMSSSFTVQFATLKRAGLFGNGPSIGLASHFNNCYTLKQITPRSFFSNNTNLGTLFQNCTVLDTLPFFDMRKNASLTSFCFNAYSFRNLPPYDTTSVTSFSQTFVSASNMEYIPQINMSKGQNMLQVFNACVCMKTYPYLDFSSATNMSLAFSANYSLVKFNGMTGATANTNLNQCFLNCFALREFPPLDTSAVTNFTESFRFTGIRGYTFPSYNLSKGTDFSRTFYQTRYRTLPTLDLSSGITFTGMMAGSFLISVPGMTYTKGLTFGTNAVTDSGILQAAVNIRRMPMYGISASIDLRQQILSPSALDEIFTGLATVGTTTYITITNNWGVSGCSTGIATSKGWTIVN